MHALQTAGEWRTLAIGAGARARRTRPIRYLQDRACILTEGGACAGSAQTGQSELQQVSAVKQAVAGGLFPLQFFHGWRLFQ